MMWRTAILVMRKDLLVEWRSRVIMWQVVPFGVMALLITGLAIGPDPASMRRAAPGLFYLVALLVALLAIGRSHSFEAPVGTRTSVRMLGLDPSGVFLGKSAALFIELTSVATLLLAGVVLFLHSSLWGTIDALPSVVIALAALSAAGTIYGSLVSDARSQATLLPIISLPPFAAILVVGEKAFASALNGGPVWKWTAFLSTSLVAYLAVGILLYGIAEESS